MRARGLVTGLSIAVVALFVSATAARAQITTGTVAGTVKDQQSGVIPGATVTLDQRCSRHKIGAGLHVEHRRLRLPQHRHRKLQHRRRDDWVQNAQAIRDHRQRRRLRATRHATIEIGGLEQTVQINAESPIVQTQTGERSFTVSTAAVPKPAHRESQLRATRLAGAGRGRHRHQPGATGRGRREQRDDGRRLDDGHRQQRVLLQMNGVDRRSEGADVDVSGGIRAVQRAADHGDHQERIESIPRIGLRRRTQFEMERQFPPTS